MVELGEPAAELALPSRGARGDGADRLHAAPGLEVPQRPDRHLLQADDVRAVGGDELDHLAEERAPLRRDGVAVEEVPRADDDRHAA